MPTNVRSDNVKEPQEPTANFLLPAGHHQHGLSIDDVDDVLTNPSVTGTSSATGRPCVWGYTLEGIYIIVVYDEIDEDTIRVVTAYEVPERR